VTSGFRFGTIAAGNAAPPWRGEWEAEQGIGGHVRILSDSTSASRRSRCRSTASLLAGAALVGIAVLPPFTAQAQSVWGGAGSTTTTPDYNLNTNWGPAAAPVASGQSAVFAATGSTAVTVTAGPIAPDAWTFNANSQSYTVSGAAVSFGGSGVINNASAGQAISIANNLSGTGAAKLQQLGNSTLTLSGTNTYSGLTIVSAGTLVITGSISGGANMNGGTLTSTGTIGGGLTGTAGTVNAQGALNGLVSQSGVVVLNVTGNLTNNNSLFLNQGAAQLNVSGGDFTGIKQLTNIANGVNAGIIVSAGRTLSANGIINAAGASLSNAGTVSALGAQIINEGSFDTAQATSVVTGGITNTGTVQARNIFSGPINNNDTGLFTSVAGNLTGNSTFTNSSTARLIVSANSNFTGITTLTNTSTDAHGILVSTGTTLSANAVVNAAGSTIDNNGTLRSLLTPISNAGTLNSTSNSGAPALFGGINNTGTVNASGALDGPVDNSGAGVFNTFNTLHGNGSFLNRDTARLTVSDFPAGNGFSGLTSLTNTSTAALGVVVFGDLAISGMLTNSGGIAVGGNGTLAAGGFDNQTGGLITVAVNASVIGNLNNAGTVGNAGIWAGNVVSNTGTINNGFAFGGTVANAGTFNNNASGSVSGLLTNTAGITTNNGVMSGGAVVSGGAFNNTSSGQVFGLVSNTGGATTNNGVMNGDAAISGGSFTNNAGATIAGLFTSTGGATTNDGALNGGANVSGGFFTGTGTVTNLNVSGGTFAPGNGTPGSSMTVTGNLAFQSGALYLVQLNPATSTFANVAGTATLNGSAGAAFMTGSYVAKQYTILTAAGGVTGAFGSFDTLGIPSGFRASLSYDANDVYLNLALGLNPPGTLNGNQQNVFNALASFFNSTGSIPAVFGTLTPAGLTQLSGEAATGSQQTTFDAMGMFMGMMTDPFIAGRGDGVTSSSPAPQFAEENDAANAYASAGKARSKSEREAYAAIYRKASIRDNYDPRWSVWAVGYGGSQTTDGNTASGSNNTRSSIGGVAVGADYRFSPYTIAGFAIAGGGTNFSVNGSGTGRSDLFQAGAFVRHTIGAAYISAALAYGWQDITTDRTVTVAGTDLLRANFNANAWSGRVEGGYRFVAPWMGGVGITPYAAGQFVTFDLPAYAEQAIAGANTFALSYAGKSVTDTRSELGLRSDKSFAVQNGIFTLRGRAAWAHDFNTDRNITPTFQTLPGASFVVNGAAHAPDSALVTASAEMKWLNGFSLAGTFEGEFSNVTTSYAGKGVVRYAW
jgi:uncharacterized protein with beta-barrel porin domain